MSYWISERLGLYFPFTLRLFPLLADAFIVILIFLTMRRKVSTDEACRWALVYALNPITICVTACHGQFDVLPAALTFGALLFVPRSSWRTGLFLGLGVLDKSWPVLAWPQIMANLRSLRQRVIVTVMMAGIPLVAVELYTLYFHAKPLNVLLKAISYNWGVGIWGYTYLLRIILIKLLNLPHVWEWFLEVSRYITIGILGWIWFARARYQSSVRGFLSILFGFFAFGHAFSIQYLLWPVVFAVYLRDRIWLARYILGASSYMFLAYYTLIFQNVITHIMPWPQADLFLIIPSGIPVWLITVFWLRNSLKDSNTNS